MTDFNASILEYASAGMDSEYIPDEHVIKILTDAFIELQRRGIEVSCDPNLVIGGKRYGGGHE